MAEHEDHYLQRLSTDAQPVRIIRVADQPEPIHSVDALTLLAEELHRQRVFGRG